MSVILGVLVLILLILASYGKETMLKVIYIVFLAIFIALFVGMGVEVFYSSPDSPEYPSELQYSKVEPSGYNAEQRAVQEKYDRQQKDFQAVNKVHNRYVSMIVIAISVMLLVLSLTVLHQIAVISDGVLLGSIMVLLYGIIRGFDSDSDKFRFLIVSVGLIIAIALGYIRFIKPEKVKA